MTTVMRVLGVWLVIVGCLTFGFALGAWFLRGAKPRGER